MRLIHFMSCCLFLIFAAGCQSTVTEVDASTTSTAQPSSVVSTKVTVSQAATENPFTNDSNPTREKAHMPVFLEVVQSTVIDERGVQDPTISVGPRIYLYEADRKVLGINPKVTLKSGTELLIGVARILQTSNQVYENQEIIQYPLVKPTLIHVVANDLATDTITIVFADESFELAPGEKRTFKQPGAGPNQPMHITTFSNHGRIKEIQALPPDGSLR